MSRWSFFVKTVNDFQLLTISAKSSVLDVGQGSKYAFLKNFDPTQFQIKVWERISWFEMHFFFEETIQFIRFKDNLTVSLN